MMTELDETTNKKGNGAFTLILILLLFLLVEPLALLHAVVEDLS